MNSDFEAIDTLKKEWDSLQPLSPENDARLWKKLRLEWNYNSNHIEGNTLTYGETEMLLLHDITTGDHRLRDYEEMKAHDLGIVHARKLAADQRIIGEGDIRDLNKIILKEPFWKEAITIDGQSTSKQVIPGEYKTTPNNVRTATSDIFAFASPAETPAKMQELVRWLRKELEAPTKHILELVTILHHDFVLIHPFDDGNGRVARLLVNYVLLRSGYPPLIVKSADKTGYLTALRKADAGDVAALTAYLVRQAEWSLNLCIRAAKGESIEEPSDVEKEIALFVRDQQQHVDRVKRRSPEAMIYLYKLSWERLFSALEEKLTKIYPLFSEVEMTASANPGGSRMEWRPSLENLTHQPNPVQFHLLFTLKGYRGQAKSPFNLNADLVIHFSEFEYALTADSQIVAKKLYSQPILADEIESITTSILRRKFDEIKRQSGHS